MKSVSVGGEREHWQWWWRKYGAEMLYREEGGTEIVPRVNNSAFYGDGFVVFCCDLYKRNSTDIRPLRSCVVLASRLVVSWLSLTINNYSVKFCIIACNLGVLKFSW